MRINFTSRKITLRDSLKEYTEKKLSKLEKFFGEDCTVNVIFSLETENVCKAEITAEQNGIIFRAQSTSPDHARDRQRWSIDNNAIKKTIKQT